MLHEALPADEFQINSCTSFAPEENMQEINRPRINSYITVDNAMVNNNKIVLFQQNMMFE
jgi:hypothetical protein